MGKINTVLYTLSLIWMSLYQKSLSQQNNVNDVNMETILLQV